MHQMKTSLAENGYMLVELRGSMPTKDMTSKEEVKKSDAKIDLVLEDKHDLNAVENLTI